LVRGLALLLVERADDLLDLGLLVVGQLQFLLLLLGQQRSAAERRPRAGALPILPLTLPGGAGSLRFLVVRAEGGPHAQQRQTQRRNRESNSVHETSPRLTLFPKSCPSL